MIIETLVEIYERDLNKLKEEIYLCKNENDLWVVKGEIKNSAGNLCLHLCGNLLHFIGAVLGKSGYVRQREKEFSEKNIPVEKLISEIENTISVIKKVLSEMKENDLEKIYPIHVFGKEMTTGFFLIHLTTHFNYHLGQINYHRRLLK